MTMTRTLHRWWSMLMASMSATTVDSVDWIRHRQRPQGDSLVPIELEAGISVNHDPAIELECVRNIFEVGMLGIPEPGSSGLPQHRHLAGLST
jgi:hypothetical protein